MFKIAIIIFRECLEIAILLSIILASTKNVQNRTAYIISGIMIGCVGAALLAFFTTQLAFACDGIGSELFDICIMILTVIVIGWTVTWMRDYSSYVKQEVTAVTTNIAVGKARKFALTAVVAITIFREAAEVVLFIYSLSSASSVSSADYLAGLILGMMSGALCGVAIYRGLLKYAGKYIFRICSIMLIFIAAGIAADAAGLLTSTGIVTIFSQPIWDSSWLVQDMSMFGQILKIFIGYEAKPNILQLLCYTATIAILFWLNRHTILRKIY